MPDTDTELDNLRKEVAELSDEVEQLRVQLAGCAVAAMGGTTPPVLATRDMWGWSPAYQDVLELRLAYDELRGWRRTGRYTEEPIEPCSCGENQGCSRCPTPEEDEPEGPPPFWIMI